MKIMPLIVVVLVAGCANPKPPPRTIAPPKPAQESEKPVDVPATLNSALKIGMTKEEVKTAIWFPPERINTSVTVLGTREQWVYGRMFYLYFLNGKLESWQTTQTGR
jgi:hypothetical protein